MATSESSILNSQFSILNSLVPQTHLLPNGQTLCYFPNNALGLVKLDITVEAGSRYQKYKSQAYVANRLFGETTARRDAGEVAEFLDFRGIVVEKTTDVCVGNLSFYFLRRYAEELFELIREMFDTYSLDNQAFKQSGISKVFEAVCASRRQQLAVGLQKTSYVARNRFYELLYGTEHPLGTYAMPEDVDVLTLDAVTDFIHQHYHLDTAHLVMSGMVDEELLSLADQYLSPSLSHSHNEPPLPSPSPLVGAESGELKEENSLSRQRPLLRGATARPGYDPSILNSQRFVSRVQSANPKIYTMPRPRTFSEKFSIPNSVQSTIRIGRVLPVSSLEGWDEVPGYVSDSANRNSQFSKFMVLNTVLGGYFGSRLMSNIREDKGYTYGIYSTTQIYRGSIVFYITADVAKEATDAAVDEIFKEIHRLQTEPITEEELDRVRKYMMGDFIRSMDGVFEVSERYCQMSSTHVVDPNTGTDPLASSLLEAITHTTPAQLQSLAQTHLKDLITVTVG